MSNLLIRGATDPEGRNVDIAIRDGRIVDAEDAEAAEVIDAGGYMVSPALVEPHYHLTSCFVEPDELVEKPFETQIDKLGRRKQAFTIEDTVERVSRALRIMAARGVVHVRSYADVDGYARMVCYDALKEARGRFAGIVDIDIVVFPQHGLISDPLALGLAREALQDGARWIGTNPQLERDPDRITREIDLVYDLAEEFGTRADFHCDETDRPESLWIEVVLRKGLERGFKGRLAVAHCMSLGKQTAEKRHEIYAMMRELDVAVAVSPHAGLLYGDAGAFMPGRGMAPVKELIENGVRVAIAQEAFGSMFAPHLMLPDPVWSAQLMAYAAKLFTDEGLAEAWRMITENGALLSRREGHGMTPGSRADLLLVRAANPAEALTTLVPERIVIRDGRVAARSTYHEELISLQRQEPS
ncbi:MAG: amidohydrolase family protein [Bauldia sp.]|uniref:amidohydrolase family protein n=1 Tax=Bauldia sp. TaxID=2575872 RepID=UPI001DCA502D|nr:amidohydrolase family protein [Bauldia sp.]MCB1497514.1 amidohydrolase family protein [Bauldia sp.]